MFTGLIEALGQVETVQPAGAGQRLTLSAPSLVGVEGTRVGDSVAINGACLTVVAISGVRLSFEAGPETLRRTNLGELRPKADRVNLERALRLGDRLGGHLVQGHVDGIGHIAQRQRQGHGQDEWELFWFSCPAALAEQMVPKGSVAVDGVSLTVVDVTADGFSVALIPHTLAVTTLGFKRPGASVNLETDLLAKYVWKCLRGGGISGGVTRDTLQQAGFLRNQEP
jgi:riboflavin synthase